MNMNTDAPVPSLGTDRKRRAVFYMTAKLSRETMMPTAATFDTRSFIAGIGKPVQQARRRAGQENASFLSGPAAGEQSHGEKQR